MDLDLIIEGAVRKYKPMKSELDTAEEGVGLIYPKRRSGEKRISEQELKMLFCAEALKEKKLFSVETPTVETFAFIGSHNMSGNIDVCIYGIEGKKYVRKNNMEFKAHNGSDYQSDFEKLLGEKGDNYFIHVLESMNNRTLYKEEEVGSRKPVINKYIEAIERIYKQKKPNNYTKLTFYICVLDPFVLLKNTIDKKYKDDIGKIKNKLELGYSVKKGVFSLENSNWTKVEI